MGPFASIVIASIDAALRYGGSLVELLTALILTRRTISNAYGYTKRLFRACILNAYYGIVVYR